MKPLVSVIIPVYNASNYLKDSINSVINQTYDNIEIICIDDFSTDNSYDICLEMKKKYNIKLYKNNKNKGQEYTRNYGLDMAKGKYITFLDADDTLEYNMIEYMVNKAEATKSDIVIGLYSKVLNGNIISKTTLANQNLYSKNDFIKLILNDIDFEIISCIGSKLYNTEFLNSNNIRFNNIYKYNEDMGFALESINSSQKIYFVNYSFYNYLIRNNGSVMSSYKNEMYNTIKNVWLLMREMFIGINDFKQKEDLYYSNIAILIINSLYNEINYKNYNEFYKTALVITNDELFMDTIKSKKVKLKYKLILYCLKLKLFNFCYLLMNVVNKQNKNKNKGDSL